MCLGGERFPPWSLMLVESPPTSVALIYFCNSVSAYTPTNSFRHTPAQSSISMYMCTHAFPSYIYHSPSVGVHWHSVTCAHCRRNSRRSLSPPYARFYGLSTHCGWLFSAVLVAACVCVWVCACACATARCVLACGGHPVFHESFLRAFCSLRFIDVVKLRRIMPDALKDGREGIEKVKFCHGLLCEAFYIWLCACFCGFLSVWWTSKNLISR